MGRDMTLRTRSKLSKQGLQKRNTCRPCVKRLKSKLCKKSVLSKKHSSLRVACSQENCLGGIYPHPHPHPVRARVNIDQDILYTYASSNDIETYFSRLTAASCAKVGDMTVILTDRSIDNYYMALSMMSSVSFKRAVGGEWEDRICDIPGFLFPCISMKMPLQTVCQVCSLHMAISPCGEDIMWRLRTSDSLLTSSS